MQKDHKHVSLYQDTKPFICICVKVWHINLIVKYLSGRQVYMGQLAYMVGNFHV